MLQEIVITVITIIVVTIFALLIRHIFKQPKYTKLSGYRIILNIITALLASFTILYLLNIWGILQLLFESIVAAGIITVVIFLTIKDIWLSNALAGLSLVDDKLIRVGAIVEIANQKGAITEITLTRTKVRTKNGILLVPNRKLREEIVLVLS